MADNGTPTWMIYGATGYTGELIAKAAVADGHSPIVAGRNAEKSAALASELGLEARSFSLDDPEAITAGLDGVRAVLHCAGPFVDTSRPMVKACLESKVSYLDITGEIAVFEACQRKSEQAREAGISIIPGVGFDVVPTDCLAAQLAAKLPDADSLELAFATEAGPSQGTAKTAIKGLGEGGAIRKDGRITKVPIAWRSKTITFADKERSAVSIPWGDVSTAHYSTGIDDIVVYMAMPPKAIRRMRWARPFTRVLASKRVQSVLLKRVAKGPRGPSEDRRERCRSQLWGRVTKGDKVVEGTLTTAEAYKLTIETALESALRVTRAEVAPGTRTPSQAFGANFIDSFSNTTIQIGEVEPIH